MTPIIREYRLFAELARGGMGSVYLARRRDDGPSGKWLAIKVMNARFRDDADARLMMLDEAHTAARVRNPYVASVVDVGSYDEGYYLVMEYVEGCSLQQLLLTNPGYRPPELIVPILVDVLSGLHAAHTLRDPNGDLYGIIHRDVTPHNVLVGIDGVSKITDFGIALAKDRYTATQFGMRKGKAPYMAPEQFQDAGAISPQIDVWALGVSAFVALTGVHPFGEGLNPNTLHNVMHAEPPVPSQVGCRPPSCFDWVLLTALSRRREARFQDAAAFADALLNVAGRYNLLGTREEVAAWVKRSWGAELDSLKRRVESARVGEIVTAVQKPVRRSSPPPLPPVYPPDEVTGDLILEAPTMVRSAPTPTPTHPAQLRRGTR